MAIGEQASIEITCKISRLPEIEHAVTVQLLGIPNDSELRVEAATVNPATGMSL